MVKPLRLFYQLKPIVHRILGFFQAAFYAFAPILVTMSSQAHSLSKFPSLPFERTRDFYHYQSSQLFNISSQKQRGDRVVCSSPTKIGLGLRSDLQVFRNIILLLCDSPSSQALPLPRGGGRVLGGGGWEPRLAGWLIDVFPKPPHEPIGVCNTSTALLIRAVSKKKYTGLFFGLISTETSWLAKCPINEVTADFFGRSCNRNVTVPPISVRLYVGVSHFYVCYRS